VVHRLHHKRIAGRPVVAPTGNQSDSDRIPPRHQAVAVVFDLVNPVGTGRRLWGGGGQARLNEARPVSGQALTHTFDRHAGNLGSRSQKSNRWVPCCRARRSSNQGN
jgi:hypothetical protein